MEEKTAWEIIKLFNNNHNPTEDDIFEFTEAAEYLVRNSDTEAMIELGGYYYGIQNYDLAYTYYQMAADQGNEYGYLGLGYIFYYGRLGAPDYQRAFEAYSKAADLGNVNAAYKVADMYKNGYYVKKSYNTYKTMIQKLFSKAKRFQYVGQPYPEIALRLAEIRESEGKKKDAANLYFSARRFLDQRLKWDSFFGNLEIMKDLVHRIYNIISFDEDNMSFYDLYYLRDKPCTVLFRFGKNIHVVNFVKENGNIVIQFDDNWYEDIDALMMFGKINNRRLTEIQERFYSFEVEYHGTD